MSGFPSPSRSRGDLPPGGSSCDDEPVAVRGPDALLGRPTPAVSARERIEALFSRVPVSPGRLLIGGGAAVLALLVAAWLFRPPPPAVETDVAAATAGGADGPGSAPRHCLLRCRAGVGGRGRRRIGRPTGRVPAGSGSSRERSHPVAGLRAGADRNRLNLAAPLADGQRLYVPKVGELAAPTPLDPTGGTGGSSSGGSPSVTPLPGDAGGVPAGTAGSTAPVDLNTATADQLDTLPGVGPATAAAILDYRSQHGPFHSVDELLDVRGIGDAKLAALRAKVQV